MRAQYPDYTYEVLTENEYVTFKYFDRIQNDNSAFFDKYRNNWLHILTDDAGENYNRTTCTRRSRMNTMKNWTRSSVILRRTAAESCKKR